MTPVSEETTGFNIRYLHDSKNCESCKAIKAYYQYRRTARFHRTRASSDVHLFGLVTYLERFFELKAKSENKCCECSPKKHVQRPVNTQDVSSTCSSEECDTSDVELEDLKKRDTEEIHAANVNLPEKPQVSKPKIKCDGKETLVPKKPQLGSLKRKRTALKNLLSDKNYEDDIFEREKTCDFVLLSDNESDSVDLQNMKTPTLFCLTPCEASSSPSYEDCYSPKELELYRKDAEEYQYRRRKRRKIIKSEDEDEEEVKVKEDPTTQLLEDACKVLEDQFKKSERTREQDEDEKEDYYFSDLSDG